MADLSITAAQVLPGTGAKYFDGTAGATITAGDLCYYDTSAGTVKLADANDSATTATVAGIALNGASAGQPVKLQTAGTITIGAGASITAGEIYVASATAGGICPEGDLAAGHYVSMIGVGDASDGIVMEINNSGVEVPA